MKKLTIEDWKTIQKNQPSRYFIQSIEDGKLSVTFDSELVVIDGGEEDLLGRMRDSDKKPLAQAKVFIKGEPKLYVMGNPEFSFTRQLINVCLQNSLKPEDLPGKVFEITRTGDWTQEIEYIGEDDGTGKVESKGIEISENTKQDIMDVIKEIKISSPDILKGGVKKPDFLKLVNIRGKVKTTDVERLLPELEKEGILEVKDDRVNVK